MDEKLFVGSGQLDGTSDNPPSCDRYPGVSPNLSELEGQPDNHKEARPFKCHLCDRTYRHAGSLANHKKTHQVGLYTCLICQREYSNPMGLKNHLRTHSEERRFSCNECGESFRMARQLSSHRRASHGFYSASNGFDAPGGRDGFDAPGGRDGFDVSASALVENGSLMSNLENYIAESMVAGDFSQLVPKYYPAEEKSGGKHEVKAEASVEESEERVTDRSAEERRFKCKQCGKAYKHAGSLANHKQSHSVGVYQCAICYKEFTNLMAMKNHCRLHSDSRTKKRYSAAFSSAQPPSRLSEATDAPLLPATAHDEPQPVSESSVSEEESWGNPLVGDVRPEHSSPLTKAATAEPYAALSLNTAFQVPKEDDLMQWEETPELHKHSFDLEAAGQSLMEHSGSEEEAARAGEHSESRPFKCQECGRTYRHAGSLINHKKTHQTGVYNCSMCSKQLFNVAALKNHLRAHFKSRAGRRLEDTYFHSDGFSDELFHGAEDSYQCAVCHLPLTSEADLLQHQTLHRNEAVGDTGCESQCAGGSSAPGNGWGDNPPGSQGSSEDSDGQGIPEAIKREVENLALQPPFQQWSQESSLDNCPAEVKPEDPGPSFQNHFMNVSQSPENKMARKERDPSEPEERESADDRPYKCEDCGKTYRHKSSLLNHKLTHKTGIYPCTLCPKQYPNLMALRNHLRFHSRRGTLSAAGRQFYGEPIGLQSGACGAYPELSVGAAPCESPTGDSNAVGAEGSGNDEPYAEVGNTPPASTGPEAAAAAIKSEAGLFGSQSSVCQTKETEGRGSPGREPPEKKVYECDLCEKTYRHSGSLINHKRTHQTGDYACSVCSKHVGNLAALKNHLRIHHKVKKERLCDGNENSGFLYPGVYFPHDSKGLLGCTDCEEVFQSEEDLLAHQALHAGLQGGPWGHVTEDVTAESDPGMERTGGCGDLDHSSSAHADDSLDSSEDAICSPAYRCDECGEVCSTSEGLHNHKHTHQPGIYQCSFCPKEYPNLSALRTHFQTHTKPHRALVRDALNGSAESYLRENQSSADHRYDCGHCGMIFCSEADFHQHQVAHEDQVKSETSSAEDGADGRQFPAEAALLGGMKDEEEGECPREAADGTSHLSHICGFCGQTYDGLESLEAHSVTHRDENLPSAGECRVAPEAAVGFQTTDLPQSDEAAPGDPPSDDKSPEGRRYTCDQCGKSYRHGGSLVNHKKTHLVGNFQCVACSRQYPNLAAYRNHVRHQHRRKQPATPNNLHKLHVLNPAGTGEALGRPLPVRDPSSNLYGPQLLYDASETTPEPAPRSLGPNGPAPHTGRVVASLKRARAKPPRKASKKRRPLPGPPLGVEVQSASADPQNGSAAADKSAQVCEYCGKTCGGINELVIHLSGGCDGGSSALSSARGGGVGRRPHPPAYKAREAEEPGFHKRPFRCEVCGRSYRHAGSLINHKQTHKTGVFRCAICQKRFFNLMAMKNHNRIHFELRRHKCPDCGKAFRLQKQLDAHQRIHRESPATRKPRRRNRRGAKAHAAALLQQHQKSPEEPEADGAHSASPDPSKQGLSKKAVDPDSRPYQCEECGRSYRHAGSLINHKKSHKMGQYCCTTCGKTYPNLMAMKNHQRTHYETKKYHCLECGKAFKWIRQLVRHQHVHARRAKLTSSLAGGSQGADSGRAGDVPQGQEEVSLSSGSQSQSGAGPAAPKLDLPLDHLPPLPLRPACQRCGVLFVSQNELENHKCSQSTEKTSGQAAAEPDRKREGYGLDAAQPHRAEERPYRCNLCGRTYRHAGSLINHKNTHKSGEYKCAICSKQFFNPMSMRHHLRTHNAEKRFQCLRCGKAFSSSVKLMCHHRVHTGERPFQCPTCGRGFSSKLTLRHHQRSHRESLSNPPASSSPGLPSAVVTKSGAPLSSEGAAADRRTSNAKEERRFKCEQCDKSYRHAASLLNHRKARHGRLPVSRLPEAIL